MSYFCPKKRNGFGRCDKISVKAPLGRLDRLCAWFNFEGFTSMLCMLVDQTTQPAFQQANISVGPFFSVINPPL